MTTGSRLSGSQGFYAPATVGNVRFGISECRGVVGLIASSFSTSPPAVLEWEWLEILEWYCVAHNQRMDGMLIDLELAKLGRF